MGSDRFCFPSFGDHEELREDRNTLQVDRESPEYLHDTELVVEDQGKDRDWSEEELNAECIVIAIIGSFELYEHQVDCTRRADNEEDLHDCIVDTNKVSDKVEISGDKYNEEKCLAFPRNTGT